MRCDHPVIRIRIVRATRYAQLTGRVSNERSGVTGVTVNAAIECVRQRRVWWSDHDDELQALQVGFGGVVTRAVDTPMAVAVNDVST